MELQVNSKQSWSDSSLSALHAILQSRDAASHGLTLYAITVFTAVHEADSDCRCQALHTGCKAAALAAVMENIHTYYKQFQFMIQERLQKELGPIEKHLKVPSPAHLAA